MLKNFNKEKMAEYIGFIIISLLILAGTVGKDFATNYIRNQEWTVNSLKEDARYSQRVNNLTTELRVKTNSSRVVISLFHNGGYFGHGVPYKKSSVLYESADLATSPIGNYNQHIPLMQLSAVLEGLTRNPSSAFIVQTDETPDSSWKYALIQEGVKTSYYRALYHEGRIFGYILVGFTNRIEFSQETADIIALYAGVITSILARSNQIR